MERTAISHLVFDRRLFRRGVPGAGTIYLLRKSPFGYFVGVTVLIGGALSLLFSHANARGTHSLLYPGSGTAGTVAYLVFTATLPSPRWALDPTTHVPVGSAFPGYVRVLTGPFSIAGALCLVFGAIYSAYVYMPKHKVLRAKVKTPVLAQWGNSVKPRRPYSA